MALPSRRKTHKIHGECLSDSGRDVTPLMICSVVRFAPARHELPFPVQACTHEARQSPFWVLPQSEESKLPCHVPVHGTVCYHWMIQSRCVACQSKFEHKDDNKPHGLCEPCRIRLSGKAMKVKRSYRRSTGTTRKDTFDQRIQAKVSHVLMKPTCSIEDLKQFNNI